MSKAIKMARVSAKGRFNLFWDLSTSTIISALGVIIIARLPVPTRVRPGHNRHDGSKPHHSFQRSGLKPSNDKTRSPIQVGNKTANVKSVIAAGLLSELILDFSLSLISFTLS